MQFNFKKFSIFILFFLLFLAIPSSRDNLRNFGRIGFPVLADSIDDCINNNDSGTDCLTLIKDRIKGLEDAINPLKNESTDLQKKITSARSQITQLSNQITNLNTRLSEKQTELDNQQKLLAERVKRYYKSSKKFSPFLIFLSSNEGTSLLQQYTLYQSVISQDKFMITQYTTDITTLNQNKTGLETQTAKLASIKKTLESRFSFLSQEINKAETYKTQLTENLKKLEAQRLASLGLPTTTGSGISCVDDRTIDPGFGTGFAFFTFGIPHHVGLNQYGAYGRAKAGQNYDQILKAYYNFDEYQNKTGITIKVNNGNGLNQGSVIWTGSLEDYVKRIYEVPASWPVEALKAQAVAARSYVLAVTENGNKSICNNQYCQVFKTEAKGGNWDQAVNDTSGKVMVVGGQPITAWFASTAGGYTFSSGDIWNNDKSWTKRLRDTSGDVNSLDDLKSKAYDKDSPCFYSAQGYRKEYNKSAWLKPAEVGDIVNTILLSQRDSSVNNNLSPIDQGGWSVDKIKEELKNRGGAVCNTVNSTSLSFDFNNGRTTKIALTCDTGTYSFDGSTFKSYFNARAPANIAIVGPLFNVEKR